MKKRLFKWVGKLKKEDNAIFNLLKFFYLISYDPLKQLFDVLLSLWLSHFFTQKKWNCFIAVVVIMALLNVWYWLINSYRNHKRKYDKNSKIITTEINAMTTTLDNHIIENGSTGVFEFASDLVSSSLYNKLHEIIGCEIRVSVIQQFVEDGKNNCVMISRKSKSRQNCQKSQRVVKYNNKNKTIKEYYYMKVLVDNDDNMIIFNQNEIEKKFFYKNPDRKSDVKQYLCIPEKMQTTNIVFLLQLDANIEDAFGKTEEEIYHFYDNYINPYVCFLKHAYNIARNLDSKDGRKGDA